MFYISIAGQQGQVYVNDENALKQELQTRQNITAIAVQDSLESNAMEVDGMEVDGKEEQSLTELIKGYKKPISICLLSTEYTENHKAFFQAICIKKSAVRAVAISSCAGFDDKSLQELLDVLATSHVNSLKVTSSNINFDGSLEKIGKNLTNLPISQYSFHRCLFSKQKLEGFKDVTSVSLAKVTEFEVNYSSTDGSNNQLEEEVKENIKQSIKRKTTFLLGCFGEKQESSPSTLLCHLTSSTLFDPHLVGLIFKF